jgi:hypothetical protein
MLGPTVKVAHSVFVVCVCVREREREKSDGIRRGKEREIYTYEIGLTILCKMKPLQEWTYIMK